jgi:hypothetical protein
MGMFGGKDDDEEYFDYLKEGSMFGKKDREEWQSKRDRAREIASGLVSGIFERDEEVWEEVEKIKEQD